MKKTSINFLFVCFRLSGKEILEERNREDIKSETVGTSGWSNPKVPKVNKRFLRNVILQSCQSSSRIKKTGPIEENDEPKPVKFVRATKILESFHSSTSSRTKRKKAVTVRKKFKPKKLEPIKFVKAKEVVNSCNSEMELLDKLRPKKIVKAIDDLQSSPTSFSVQNTVSIKPIMFVKANELLQTCQSSPNPTEVKNKLKPIKFVKASEIVQS